ncbi:MAG: hypothetical protein IMF07_03380 [Proteobacteria bacterium]|nr:hypothetical protein [Pseudomonadota bacterium]
MQNRVVVQTINGEIIKGVTNDFSAGKEFFHLKTNDSEEILEIDILDLKAVYFVKSYEGNPDYDDKAESERAGFGKKIRVMFKDGEEFFGYTQGFSPNRPGFFVFPVDADSNNDRIFIVSSATDEIDFV